MLLLDGFQRLQLEIAAHRYELTHQKSDDHVKWTFGKPRSWVRREVVARTSLPFQALLIAIQAVFKHVLRALDTTASGFLSGYHLRKAGKDLLSAVVEAICLPVLGICAAISPKQTFDLIQDVRDSGIEDVLSTAPSIIFELPYDLIALACEGGITLLRGDWNQDHDYQQPMTQMHHTFYQPHIGDAESSSESI